MTPTAVGTAAAPVETAEGAEEEEEPVEAVSVSEESLAEEDGADLVEAAGVAAAVSAALPASELLETTSDSASLVSVLSLA